MADGDIVHGRPNYYYKRSYEYICEGKHDSTWTLMGALLKQIKDIGNVPLMLLKQIAEDLTQEFKNGQTNWTTLSRQLEKIKNQYLGSIPNYSLSIVFTAIKRVVSEFRYEDRKKTDNIQQVLVEQYMKELYKSQFEERIELTSTHHNNIDPKILIDRVQDINPRIYQAIEKWAKKTLINKDVSKLRRPPNQKNILAKMDEDLQ